MRKSLYFCLGQRLTISKSLFARRGYMGLIQDVSGQCLTQRGKGDRNL